MSINHIAIIPDGNGRWATKNGVSKAEGHSAGAKNAKAIIELAAKAGVNHLTLFGFSSENWNRSEQEVDNLMSIMLHYITSEIDQLAGNDVKLSIIGDRNRLSQGMLDAIAKAEDLTKDNKSLNLYIAISYGGKDEIVRAFKKLSEDNISLDQVDENVISKYLDIRTDVDLVIRTSGEKRLSNFLIWQSAYSELYFSEKLWPDFDEEEFGKALDEFKTRERNFGYARKQVR